MVATEDVTAAEVVSTEDETAADEATAEDETAAEVSTVEAAAAEEAAGEETMSVEMGRTGLSEAVRDALAAVDESVGAGETEEVTTSEEDEAAALDEPALLPELPELLSSGVGELPK